MHSNAAKTVQNSFASSALSLHFRLSIYNTVISPSFRSIVLLIRRSLFNGFSVISYFLMPQMSGNNARPNLILAASFVSTPAAVFPDDVCARARPDYRVAWPCSHSTDIGTMVPFRRIRHFHVAVTSISIGTFCHSDDIQTVCRHSIYSLL